MVKGSNFFERMVASSLALAGNSFNIKNFGGLLGNSAVLAIGVISLLQLHWLASGEQRPAVGNYSYKRVNQDNSLWLGTSPRSIADNHLDVSLAKG
uniref:Uncharacterized protein n=1 Tax=Arundo donax TaxID=35708 RepID=A0A0A9ABG2_ARUDO